MRKIGCASRRLKMASFSSKSIMESFHHAASSRRPMPSVPIRRSSSTASRTDHGQSSDWRLERRAAAVSSGRPSTRVDKLQESPRRAPTNGRISALERDGIAPANRSPAKGQQRKTNSPQRRRRSSNGGIVFSPPASPTRTRARVTAHSSSRSQAASSAAASSAASSAVSSSSTFMNISSSSSRSDPLHASFRNKIRTSTSGQMEACKDLGRSWAQRTSPPQVGVFRQAGTHTIAECRGGKFFICTREPSLDHDAESTKMLLDGLANGEYDFHISVKPCAIANSERTHQRVHIVLGYKSPTTFLCLTQDADQCLWRIDSFRDDDGGRATLLASVEDKMLRANRFSKVVVHCRTNILAVSVNGRTLVQGIVLPAGGPDSLNGAVGVACMRSKMIFKDAGIFTSKRGECGGERGGERGGPSSTDQRGGGRGGLGGRGGESKREEKLVRDGALMLPERYMRGAKNAGLGSMDGGVYGHMQSLRGTKVVEGRNISSIKSSGYGQQRRGGGSGSSSSSSSGGDEGDERMEDINGEKSPFVGDDRYLIDMVERDIIHRELGVNFDDIAGLETAKRLLNEAVSLPLLVPEFFVGIREPWKGVLLYGPPGTGKTMLAKAAAGVSDITFFNSSAASMINKYRGESEKLTRCLFRMARHYSPAIIFIDEIDALARTRGAGQEHEADRRLKSILFSEMDGIHSGGSGSRSNDSNGEENISRVVVLATTNGKCSLAAAAAFYHVFILSFFF